MNNSSIKVDYIDNFETKAIDVIKELSATANRIDIAVAFLSYQGWQQLKEIFTQVVNRGGKLRIIVRKDKSQTSPEAVEEVFNLPNTQIAFGLTDPSFHPKDYLFFEANKLTVLTSSANATYSGLVANVEGGAIVTHFDYRKDESAQKAISIFERRWQNGKILTIADVKDYKAQRETPGNILEGMFVRSINDIYRPLGVGKVIKIKNEQAKVEFNPSIFSKPPFRSENKILLTNELEMLSTPLEKALKNEWDESWRFDLKQMAARFLAANKGGQLSNARTEILPHQIFTAWRVVNSSKRKFLLADEVGLGKTIEAGMIWQALLQRGNAKRTLIITPAGLTLQWQEEMQDKFTTFFEIFNRDFTASNPRIWDLKPFAIASMDTLKRDDHKKALLENRKWDLIIFDEAHRLSAMQYTPGKVDKTDNYKLAEDLREYTDSLLLLTATPHRGEDNHSRFIHLLGLLEKNIDFTGLVDYGLFPPENAVSYFQLVLRTLKHDVTDAEGMKVFKGRKTYSLRFDMYSDERKFYKAVEKYIRNGYKSIERIVDYNKRRAAGFVLTTFQKLNASSIAAIRASLEGRKNRLTGQLSAQQTIEEVERERDERHQGEFEEKVVLLDDSEIIKNEIVEIDKLLQIKVKKEKKLDELMKLLERIDVESPRKTEEKVLIYTEYLNTQKFLVEALEKKYGKGSAVVIKGGMKLDQKKEVQRKFREENTVRFLVSTEAGGEGINLQFCHILVNYDLPWNPMRVEQRVGRIYRFGQEKVVQIYNFSNKNTIEDLVNSYFEQKLNMAAKVLGTITGEDPEEMKGVLYGQLESEIDPEEIYKRTMVEGNLNKQTKEEIEEAVKRAQLALEIATTSLFKDVSSYSFDSYKRSLFTGISLNDLKVFTEKFIKEHKRQITLTDDGLWEFLTPEILKEHCLEERYKNVTFDRTQAIRNSALEFFAIGHPFIDAMLSFCGDYDFGGHTTKRVFKDSDCKGQEGIQFNFIVRSIITREDGDEYVFDLHPVGIDENYSYNEKMTKSAIENYSEKSKFADVKSVDINKAYTVARQYLEKKLEKLWDWDEDVLLLNIAFIKFI